MPGLSVAFPAQGQAVLTIYHLTSNNLERMSVHDGYSTATLVSDLGGIVGMTLGVSLLSLLLTCVTKMTQPWRPPTKVSPALPGQ